jgi:small-conductance mechanosensitive channel
MIMLSIYGNMKWLVLKSFPANLRKFVPWITRIMFMTYLILFFIALNGYLYFAFSTSLSICIITIFIWWTITGLYITNDAIQTLYSEHTNIGKWLNQFISLEKYHSKDIKIINTILFMGILGRVSMIIWNNWYLSPGIYLKIMEHVTISFNFFGFSTSPLNVFNGILFFSFFKIIIRFIVRLISKHLSTIKEIEYRVERTLYTIGVTIAFFLSLRIAGIELEHLAIAAGALSFGIGVGLQDIMKNIISGILMMIYNPIAKNDYIHIKEFRGYIRKFTLLTTQIETLDNTDVMIPNRYILDSILENFTYKNNKFHKIHLKFYLNNLEDFHRAKKAILKFLSTQKEVLLLDTSYAPSVLIHPENAQGIELEVICTLKQFENEDKTISDMYLNIIPLLKRAKINFQLNNNEQA